MTKPIVWTIAGSDSSTGAGIQADLKTIEHLGAYGASVVTAVTAQNSSSIDNIYYLSEQQIESQLLTLQEELIPDVIKIGMMGQCSTIDCLLRFLTGRSYRVVLDPIIQASSGRFLYSGDLKAYRQQLFSIFPYVSLLTPNRDEAVLLTGKAINNDEDIEETAKIFLEQGVKNVLIKGGHATDSFAQDYWTNGVEAFWMASPRYSPKNYRGSGCILSSAIAASLALGYDYKDAIVIAKMYINRGIRLANPFNLNVSLISHGQWPEEGIDLPYVSDQPIKKIFPSFPSCGPDRLGLYPIIDSSEWLKILLEGGIKTIQLRIKNKIGTELEAEIRESIRIAEQYQVKLFINDYWELAIKHGAYGVHLGQEDLESADLNKIYQAGIRLGISTHCYYEVARAHYYHPSYLACGPIFPTISKKMKFHPQGIVNLIRWRKILKNYLLVAIGGINQQNIQEVIETGVDGIAVISAITHADDPLLSTKELLSKINERYYQQIKLPMIGFSGQEKLTKAKVLCIGAGGLGCPLMQYLTAAGIGTMGIVDHDLIEISNLNRQILYCEWQQGMAKAVAAKQRLSEMNPQIKINAYVEKLSAVNADSLFSEYDIVVDCTDNFDTRYLINDVCCKLAKPYITASVSQFKGQCVIFLGKKGPCFRCLFPASPQEAMIPTCEEGGVIGAVSGIMGVIQATEVIKWVLGIGDSLVARLLMVDLLKMRFKEFRLSENSDCKTCRKNLENILNNTYFPTLDDYTIYPHQLKKLLENNNDFQLIDVRSLREHQDFNMGGKLIPVEELANRIHELDPAELVIVYCRSGNRSMSAVQLLLQRSFGKVKSLAGGILAWEAMVKHQPKVE